MTAVVLLVASALVPPFVPPSTTALARAPIAIPLECDAQSTLFVSVSLPGAARRRFLLDTGASVSLLDRTLAQRLRLASAGKIPSSSGFDTLVSADMSVGPLVLGSRTFAVSDLTSVRRMFGHIDGILGADVLRAMGRVTLDYSRCRLHVGGTSSTGGTRVPLTWHEGRPVVVIPDVGRLLLDSGASMLIVFDGSRPAATLRTGRSAPVRLDRMRSAGVGWAGHLPSLTLGGLDLTDVPAVAVKSWYGADEQHAPNGLLPPRLFARVHLNLAEGFATFAAR